MGWRSTLKVTSSPLAPAECWYCRLRANIWAHCPPARALPMSVGARMAARCTWPLTCIYAESAHSPRAPVF